MASPVAELFPILVAENATTLKAASVSGRDGGGAGTSWRESRSITPLPSPASGGVTSAATSTAGSGMAKARTAGQSESTGSHFPGADRSESDCGKWLRTWQPKWLRTWQPSPVRALKLILSSVSLTRRSTTSLGMERHCIQSNMPAAAAKVIRPPPRTPIAPVTGNIHPALILPPLTPAINGRRERDHFIPNTRTKRSSAKRSPHGLGDNEFVVTPPSVPWSPRTRPL